MSRDKLVQDIEETLQGMICGITYKCREEIKKTRSICVKYEKRAKFKPFVIDNNIHGTENEIVTKITLL